MTEGVARHRVHLAAQASAPVPFGAIELFSLAHRRTPVDRLGGHHVKQIALRDAVGVLCVSRWDDDDDAVARKRGELAVSNIERFAGAEVDSERLKRLTR